MGGWGRVFEPAEGDGFDNRSLQTWLLWSIGGGEVPTPVEAKPANATVSLVDGLTPRHNQGQERCAQRFPAAFSFGLFRRKEVSGLGDGTASVDQNRVER